MPVLADILSPSTWPLRLEYLSIPAALLLFVVLAGFVLAMALPRLTWLGPTRRAVAIGVRLAIVWVLVMTLGGLKWWREHSAVETIVLRDISASMGNVRTSAVGGVGDHIDALLRQACASSTREADDRIGVIRVGDHPTIEMLPGMPWTTRAASIDDHALSTGTDLDAALRLALASFSGDAMKRVVLISDGNPTRGDIESALTLASALRVPIDVIPQRYSIDRELLLERLVAPASVRAGNAFVIDAIIYSTNESPVDAILSVTDRGVPIDMDDAKPGVQSTRPVSLQRGPNPIHVRVPAAECGGLHQFVARIEPARVEGDTPSDTLLANNTADASTLVRGVPRVLLVDNSLDRNRSLEKALTDAYDASALQPSKHLELVRIVPAECPARLDDIQGFDAVILANVPRGSGGLDQSQEDAIAQYVQDAGGGLLVVGGPAALGAGNWSGSRLEPMLPLSLEPDAKRLTRRGAIVLALDCSGSMNDAAPGDLARTKQQLANESAAMALRSLAPDDYVGVVAFDSQPQWVVPLSENTDPAGADAKIRKIGGGRGTAIGPALDAAMAALARIPAGRVSQRRIVLLTDGVSAPADYRKLLASAQSMRVTISTVAIGDDADRHLLAHLARGGDGLAYVVREGDELSDVFASEARMLRRNLIRESARPIHLSAGASPLSSHALDALLNRPLPPINGMILTSARPRGGTSILLRTDDAHHDPVLAIAQSGLGRVAVFTADATSRWSSAWIGSPIFAEFWRQLVSDAARPPMSDAFDVTIKPDGDRSRIIVQAVRDEGFAMSFLSVTGRVSRTDEPEPSRDVHFTQTGSGRYEGTIDTPPGGRYVASIQYAAPSGQRGSLLAAAGARDNAEFQAARSNEPLMSEIAQRTGGRVLPDLRESTDALFDRAGLEPSASPIPLWDVLLGAMMGLFIVDVSVRRIAWDFPAMLDRMSRAFPLIAAFFTLRRVDPNSTLDTLYRARWLRENPDWLREHPEYRTLIESQSPPDTAPAMPVIVTPLPASSFDARSRARSWIEKQSSQNHQKQPPEVNS